MVKKGCCGRSCCVMSWGVSGMSGPAPSATSICLQITRMVGCIVLNQRVGSSLLLFEPQQYRHPLVNLALQTDGATYCLHLGTDQIEADAFTLRVFMKPLIETEDPVAVAGDVHSDPVVLKRHQDMIADVAALYVYFQLPVGGPEVEGVGEQVLKNTVEIGAVEVDNRCIFKIRGDLRMMSLDQMIHLVHGLIKHPLQIDILLFDRALVADHQDPGKVIDSLAE